MTRSSESLATQLRIAAEIGLQPKLQKRPIAWMRYVCGAAQFRHANDDGDPPEDQGWIALYRRGSTP